MWLLIISSLLEDSLRAELVLLHSSVFLLLLQWCRAQRINYLSLQSLWDPWFVVLLSAMSAYSYFFLANGGWMLFVHWQDSGALELLHWGCESSTSQVCNSLQIIQMLNWRLEGKNQLCQRSFQPVVEISYDQFVLLDCQVMSLYDFKRS